MVFSVDGRYKFPVDTFANINTSGLLGEQSRAPTPAATRRPSSRGTRCARTESSAIVLKN